MLFAIHDRMIHALEYLLRIDFFILTPYDWLEEAGRITGMACCSDLIYFCKQCIQITVNRQGFYILEMTARLPLYPEFLPASAKNTSSFLS